MKAEESYEYAILGAGCAGLSLAVELSQRGVTKDARVVLIDPDTKRNNDRTWSFWERGDGPFDSILSHQWTSLDFASRHGVQVLDIHPYRYKMIRGIDYYDYARSIIESDSNIIWLQQAVTSVHTGADRAVITTDDTSIRAELVFKSYLDEGMSDDQALTTLQHFGGWYIKTATNQWDSSRAVFMDFRIEQEPGETRFCYVLPLSATEALVEVAVYSEEPWRADQYDAVLSSYIDDFIVPESYSITEREYGVIPMSTIKFWQKDTQQLIHIGTAGGAVKPSSGYAFGRIQEHSRWIVDRLTSKRSINGSPFRSRFYHYDATLLHVLLVQGLDSQDIFHRFFKRNSPERVLAFLNGETSLLQELRLCASMPVPPFTRGLLHSLAT